MDQRVSQLIDSYREDYVETLRRWVRSPSVKGEAEEGAPFGREVRKMLDLGAWACVVGGAITRPLEIAQRFFRVL